jgi:hypothetical protein
MHPPKIQKVGKNEEYYLSRNNVRGVKKNIVLEYKDE